jgi:hypothetical protein
MRIDRLAAFVGLALSTAVGCDKGTEEADRKAAEAAREARGNKRPQPPRGR